MPDPELHSVLHELPLAQWARRFEGGTVEAAGELAHPLALQVGELELALEAGEVAVWIRFVGGEQPRILAAELRADSLAVGSCGERFEGEELLLEGGLAALDQVPLAAEAAVEPLVGELFDRLGSLSFVATAQPAGEILVRLPAGVHVALDGRAEVVVSGASAGPPGALRLCAPLEVRCGGEGIRLSHEHLRRLARLAGVRFSGATLHPDGEVALEGGASGALDLAVRRGLRSTSTRLSRLVRTSPHFRKLRSFLAHASDP